jgi:hypothetical protein
MRSDCTLRWPLRSLGPQRESAGNRGSRKIAGRLAGSGTQQEELRELEVVDAASAHHDIQLAQRLRVQTHLRVGSGHLKVRHDITRAQYLREIGLEGGEHRRKLLRIVAIRDSHDKLGHLRLSA